MNRYEDLFTAYVSEMRESMRTANAWWKNLRKAETREVGREQAEKALDQRWPFGPASHPRILATYRKYFLACEALNRELEDRERSLDEPSLEDGNDEKDWGEEEDDDDSDESEGFGEVETPIPGWNLLIDSLNEDQEDIIDFLSQMVYAPIGLDDAEIFV
jgi:hypothetical protein